MRRLREWSLGVLGSQAPCSGIELLAHRLIIEVLRDGFAPRCADGFLCRLPLREGTQESVAYF